MSRVAVKELEIDRRESRNDYRADVGSLPWRLMKLEIGQSISETRRIPKDELALEDTTSIMSALNGPISSSVSRVQQRTGRKFIMERAKSITSSDDLLCTIAVTRVE